MRLLPLLTALALLAGPALAQGGFLGVAIADPGSDDPPGAFIQEVQPRTAGHFFGLRPGDQVTAVDGRPVATAAAFASRIGARLPGSIVDLTVRRDGVETVLSGVLGRREGRRAAVPEGLPGFGPRTHGLPLPPDARGIPGPGIFEDWDAEVERLQSRMDALLRELEGEMQGDLQGLRAPIPELDAMRIPDFRMPRLDLDFAMPELGEGARVRIRYPGNTPQADRERLREEAVDTYGEDVEVEFAGNGTMIRIEQRRSASPPSRPRPEAPLPEAKGSGDVEEL
jgi:hypothetical protein